MKNERKKKMTELVLLSQVYIVHLFCAYNNQRFVFILPIVTIMIWVFFWLKVAERTFTGKIEWKDKKKSV